MKIAEKIAERFGNDGQNWTGCDGEELVDVLKGEACWIDGKGEARRYGFADGSAIIVTPGGWDLALSADDRCWCWAGLERHEEGCPLAAGQE